MNVRQIQIIAHDLVHGLVIGPDNRISDIHFFHTALLHALSEAHQQGWKDRLETEKLTRR